MRNSVICCRLFYMVMLLLVTQAGCSKRSSKDQPNSSGKGQQAVSEKSGEAQPAQAQNGKNTPEGVSDIKANGANDKVSGASPKQSLPTGKSTPKEEKTDFTKHFSKQDWETIDGTLRRRWGLVASRYAEHLFLVKVYFRECELPNPTPNQVINGLFYLNAGVAPASDSSSLRIYRQQIGATSAGVVARMSPQLYQQLDNARYYPTPFE